MRLVRVFHPKHINTSSVPEVLEGLIWLLIQLLLNCWLSALSLLLRIQSEGVVIELSGDKMIGVRVFQGASISS